MTDLLVWLVNVNASDMPLGWALLMMACGVAAWMMVK